MVQEARDRLKSAPNRPSNSHALQRIICKVYFHLNCTKAILLHKSYCTKEKKIAQKLFKLHKSFLSVRNRVLDTRVEKLILLTRFFLDAAFFVELLFSSVLYISWLAILIGQVILDNCFPNYYQPNYLHDCLMDLLGTLNVTFADCFDLNLDFSFDTALLMSTYRCLLCRGHS